MKTTSPLFAATLLLAAMATCARADISIVAPTLPNANVGTLVSAPVSMSNVSDLYAWQFDLSFDPIILQLTSIQEGPLLGSGGGPTVFIPGAIDNTAGTAVFTLDTLVGPVPGVSTNGIAVFFNFDPINTGTSPLDLSNVVLLDSSLNDIPFTVTNGSVDVAAVPEPSIPRWAMGIAVLGLIVIQRRLAARKRAA